MGSPIREHHNSRPENRLNSTLRAPETRWISTPLATEMCAECAFQFRWTNAPIVRNRRATVVGVSLAIAGITLPILLAKPFLPDFQRRKLARKFLSAVFTSR